MVKIATNDTFDSIIASSKPVLVDFWAVWCGPCRMLSPTVDAVAEKYEGKVDVAKCNVDDCQEIAARYGIRSIPTLLYFKDGKVVDKSIGVVPSSLIENTLDNLL